MVQSDRVPTSERTQAHLELLRERVFQTETKWPHFRLLLNDIEHWANKLHNNAVVVAYERTLLYGGYSLLAPVFARQNFISIDGSPLSADERGAYNSAMVNDPRFIAETKSRRCPGTGSNLEDSSADFLMIPNLVHHIADQKGMFDEAFRVIKPGGILYVFEPILRELHQIPDDFLRYTPFGLKNVLEASGFEPGEYELEGGPFSAVAYCWAQALEYFPEAKRAEMSKWFYDEHFPQLLAFDEEHRTNQVRKFTSFPVSFSITATKPS